MNCCQFRCLVRIECRLPRLLGVRVEAHAARCAACREYGRRVETLPGLLRELYRREAAAYAPVREIGLLCTRQPGGRAFRRPFVALALAASAAGAWLLLRPHPAREHAALPPMRRAPGLPLPAAGPRKLTHAPRTPEAPPLVVSSHGAPLWESKGTPSPSAGAASHPPAPAPDRPYLDGRDPALSLWMMNAQTNSGVARLLQQPLPAMKDDFVRPPLPLLADATGKTAGEAVKKYEKEAQVVDGRLFRKITLALKAVSLEEFCARLREQTGVELRATRGVADEKVTVFVDERPAREVMREVARLFGYLWGRVGEEGAYRYSLEQDLRSQLAEEELRSRDVHAALIALDEKLAEMKPYLEQTPAQLQAEYNRIKDDKRRKPEQDRLRHLLNGAYGPLYVYYRLSPAERTALFNGEEMRFSMGSANPDRRLPEELRVPFLQASNLVMFRTGTIAEAGIHSQPSQPVAEVPGAEPEVLLSLDRSEAGECTLHVGTHAYVKSGGDITGAGGYSYGLASGRSPSTGRPDNAAANASLRNEPLFQRVIALKPKPSCPRLQQPAELRAEQNHVYFISREFQQPHASSADVWEEAHRQTGLPIVADAYTHVHLLPQVTFERGKAFELLCKAGDELGARWRKDGEYLLARSTGYFWDKLKEVPNRLLVQWRADSERNGGLPLDDLLQMAALSDQQLGSEPVGMGITHCWGLDEWGIIGGGPRIGGEIIPAEMRKMARGLLILSPAELKASQGPDGLDADALLPEKRAALARAVQGLNTTVNGRPEKVRFRLDYVPCGSYFWQPMITRERYQSEAKHWPLVYGRKKEEVLQAARRVDPGTDAKSVGWTRGKLIFTTIHENGDRWSTSGPLVLSPLE